MSVRIYLGIFLFLILILPKSLLAQTQETDSLSQMLNEDRLDDEQKVYKLNIMARELQNRVPERALIYAQQGLLLAERINYQEGIGEALANIAKAYYEMDEYPRALQYYIRAVKFFSNISGGAQGEANSLRAVGNIYNDLGDYEQSLRYLFQALESYEEQADQSGQARVLCEIARTQVSLDDYYIAQQSLSKAREIAEKRKEKDILGLVNFSEGDYFNQRGDYAHAITLYQKAQKYFEITKNKSSLAQSLNGLGDASLNFKNKNEALSYHLEALAIQKEIRDQAGISYSYKGIGEIYFQSANYTRAADYFGKSLQIALNIDQKELIRDNYQKLSYTYEKLDQSAKALEYYKTFKKYNDSIYSQSKIALISEMQTRFGLNQQEQEAIAQNRRIEVLNKQGIDQSLEIISQKQDLRLRNIIIFASIGIILLTATLIVVLYRTQVRSKAANEKLSLQNKEIESQKVELETKSQELVHSYIKITDSIRYAEAIQKSFLPDNKTLEHLLGEFFVISKPKEIVSGDFYWVSQFESQNFLAVVDCTGHGVSGGYTSMIGQTLLNEIVNQAQIHEPSEILRLLNQRFIQVIDNEEQDFPIGMEVCLIRWQDSQEDPNKVELTFSGAKRPIYIIRNNGTPLGQAKLKEMRGTRQPIGFFQDKDRIYLQETFLIEKGSLVYLSTDGFADQSNLKNKRLGTPRLKNILELSAPKDLKTQKDILENNLKAFQKKTHQRDDITVLGFKI